MEDEVQQLNADFDYNLFICMALIRNLHPEEQKKVLRWLHRLKSHKNSLDQLHLRNDFMYYLVINIQNGGLQFPFNKCPPKLLDEKLLPNFSNEVLQPNSNGDNKAQDNGMLSFLSRNSPDGGKFLASQPIPRCGAFCYLAVVNKSRKKHNF